MEVAAGQGCHRGEDEDVAMICSETGFKKSSGNNC
jgi:hypothetical protein